MSRSSLDGTGHSRGIVQVDLMRQIMAGEARVESSAHPGESDHHSVPTQAHPLLGRASPAMVLGDAEANTRDLRSEASTGPVVVVFYLGSSCVACMTHLVELDAAMPRYRARNTKVWAVSADRPELSRERMQRFGRIQIPLLSDSSHAVASTFGVWKQFAGGNQDDGEAMHGTFIVDKGGLVQWAHVGDRPFTDIGALLAELDDLAIPPWR
jgi:peroxiredoxin